MISGQWTAFGQNSGKHILICTEGATFVIYKIYKSKRISQVINRAEGILSSAFFVVFYFMRR